MAALVPGIELIKSWERTSGEGSQTWERGIGCWCGESTEEMGMFILCSGVNGLIQGSETCESR